MHLLTLGVVGKEMLCHTSVASRSFYFGLCCPYTAGSYLNYSILTSTVRGGGGREERGLLRGP